MTKFWIGATALALTACTGSDIIPLSLEVPNSKEAIIFRIDANQLVPWDTIQITDGVLKTELPLDSSGSTFYALSFDHGASLRLGIERGDKIKGSVSLTNGITDYELSGSDLSERLLAHYKPLRQTAMLMDSLDKQAATYQGLENAAEKNAELFTVYEARITKHRDDLKSMIEEEPASLANIFALYQSAGSFYLFDPMRDSTLFRTTTDAMSEANPEHPILQVFIKSSTR